MNLCKFFRGVCGILGVPSHIHLLQQVSLNTRYSAFPLLRPSEELITLLSIPLYHSHCRLSHLVLYKALPYFLGG